MSIMPFFSSSSAFLFLSLLFLSSAADHHRHLLHQPFFPVTTSVPPTQSPSSGPQEKHTFSDVTSPNTPPQRNPFFPSSDPVSAAPPPPPPTRPATLPTFPANISSLLLPGHSSGSKSQHGHHVAKLVIGTASVVSAALLLSLLAVFFIFLRQRRRAAPADDGKSSRSDSLRLFNTAPSDGSLKHKQPPKYTSTNTSSEFLYLGTLVNSRSGGLDQQKVAISANVSGVVGVTCPASASSSSQYQKLGSPELRPLPPLPKYNVCTPTYQSGEQLNPKVDDEGDDNDNDNDEFFSPRGSSGRKQSPTRVWSSSRRDFQGIGADHFGSTSFNSRTASYPYSNTCSPADSMSSSSASPTTNTSPTSLKPKSPDSIMNFPAHAQTHNPYLSSFPSSSSGFGVTESSLHRQNSQSDGVPEQTGPSPPPPPPPPQFLEISACSRITPARDMSAGPTMSVSVSSPPVNPGNGDEELGEKEDDSEKKEDTLKPKLKPLHWDKVRASSNRAMVWDQIKSSSFQLNEEMIETLFRVNGPSSRTKDAGFVRNSQSWSQENRLIDPKKAQNIAILLRALNVTTDEVCEAISEGNSDTLGPDLLECLLKMALTREEEDMLKDVKDDDSPSKLCPAEKFLKALLDIPFAFRRIDAMLYIANFEPETDHLRRSFDTLEAACGELKNTRMFLKLLEAVLKTGNRMNIGTNRGEAHAFKLDTLLKLVDIKGTDGKTTLLHFVVQEIIKSEGARVSAPDQSPKSENITELSTLQDDLELRKLGLQVVSCLSSQMMNVKKAAAMDSATLSNDISDIVTGITKVKEVAELREEIGVNPCGEKFLASMDMFLNKAEKEIAEIQSRGGNALKTVKEVTEYFHGNSESRPFRIFAVVRDFLAILDQVCKEVGRINERTVCGGSVRPSSVNANLPPLFPALNARQNHHPGSSEEDDEDESTR
ncbi:PREDICTED: formin-like protein 2 [Tarenaya hassleriana]|uniref:formin-like protein 2 n=1 Tax=Tarenaya hassleriana TaxID=28532 RepID=UPI00053C0D94|nr:PREDICTED: formin-like protein 2 [Tarenaya hassleriana]